MSEESACLAHNNRQNCETLFAKGINQIIFRTLVADTQTPVGVMMKLGTAFKLTGQENRH